MSVQHKNLKANAGRSFFSFWSTTAMVQIGLVFNLLLTTPFVFPTSFAYRIERECEWDLYNCDYPYSIEETIQFICTHDNNCPTNFMCCRHKCFSHKICQPYETSQDTLPKLPELVSIRPGECDITLTCDVPLPIAFTKSFECFQDNDCPDHYKCCFIECYGHKVCQKAKNQHTLVPFTSSTEQKPTSSNFPTESSRVQTTTSSENTLKPTGKITTKPTIHITMTVTNTNLEKSTTLTVPAEIIMKPSDSISTLQSSTEITTILTSTTLKESTRLTVPAEIVTETVVDISPVNISSLQPDKEIPTTATSATLEESTKLTVPAEIVSETSIDKNSFQTTEETTTPNISVENVTETDSNTNLSHPTKDITTIPIPNTSLKESTTLTVLVEVVKETSSGVNVSQLIEEITTTSIPITKTSLEETTVTIPSSQPTNIAAITEITLVNENYSTQSSTFAAVSATGVITISKNVTEVPVSDILKTSPKISTETDDFGASGDRDIFSDDEDDIDISTSKSNTGTTNSYVTDDFESSGNFEKIEDDEHYSIISTSTHSVLGTTSKIFEDTIKDFEIVEVDGDDTNKTSLTNNTTKTSNETTDDLDASGDFEIIDDFQGTADVTPKTSTVLEANENFEIIKNTTGTLLNHIFNTTTETTMLTEPIETSTETENTRTSSGNNIISTVHTATDEPSKAMNNDLTIESIITQPDKIKLETQKDDKEENGSITSYTTSGIENTNLVVIQKEGQENATTSTTTILGTSSVLVSSNVSEANSGKNDFEASGDDEEDIRDLKFSGDGNYNDDEDYTKGRENKVSMKETSGREYDKIIQEEIGNNNVMKNTIINIKNIEHQNIEDSNAIQVYANENDNVHNLFYSYYDDFYDYNDIIDE